MFSKQNGWNTQDDIFYASVCLKGGTGMIASSSTFHPHLGSVIRELFRLLNAVYGIVRKH